MIIVLHKKKTKFGIWIAVFVYDFVNGDATIITNGELSILIQHQLVGGGNQKVEQLNQI